MDSRIQSVVGQVARTSVKKMKYISGHPKEFLLRILNVIVQCGEQHTKVIPGNA